jgi:hypothetical protein
MCNEDKLNHKSIKKYFEIIKFSLENYIAHEDDNPDIFSASFNMIAEIIKKNLNNEITTAKTNKNINACSVGMDILVNFILQKSSLFPAAKPIVKDNYSYYDNDRNIYGALSLGVYETIEMLSMDEKEFEGVRLLLLKIYAFKLYKDNPVLIAIQERLTLLLDKKIDEDLKERYPAVIASLIYSLSLCEPEKTEIPIHKILLTKLKTKFLALYIASPDIALDMLPSDTTLDVENKRLIRKHPVRWKLHKKTKELELL